MAKPYKLSSTRPLPPDAEILQHDGKPHVRLKERGKSILCPLTKDGTKYLRPSKRWYFDCRDATGTVHRVKGFADLKATEQLAAETERKASRVRSGYSDPAEEHARRTLADHLKDYEAHLEAKGNCTEHIRQTIAMAGAVFAGCGFVFPPDVNANSANGWLNTLRRADVPISLPPGVESFTPAEAASLLGLTLAGVRAAVQRNRLPATGNGKARRFPRATVEALALKAGRGAAPATLNHYVRAVGGFFRWMVTVKRLGSNPLDSLSLVNEKVDVRRARRELTVEELRTLLAATRESVQPFRGLAGNDRFHLYLSGAATGFRARALSNLTPADFHLDDPSPVVILPARFNKSRKPKVQPIPPDAAEQLRGYLRDRPPTEPVWGGTWATNKRGAEMIRRDLEAVGIPYTVEGPDGPEHADFHSLRHSYLTMLGRHGVDLRTAQELAGHSKPELTARYTHRRLHDLTGAVGKLPNLLPTGPNVNAEATPLRLTGTDSGAALKPDNVVRLGVVPGVVTGGTEGHQSALMDTFRLVGGDDGESTQTQKGKPVGADQHQPASIHRGVSDGVRTRDVQIHNLVL